ncbi:MAG: hypothetical protein K6T65_01420 [Peptococcaceae bacterium]|nr:hypothetical protein [Peptococcaceae bacterium]
MMIAREQVKALIDQLSEEQVQALGAFINSTVSPSEPAEEMPLSYEASIWDDWDDGEVDKVYEEMYHQLR